MKEISVIGLDLAKTIFHVHGIDKQGRRVLSKQLRRHQVLPFFAQRSPCLVGMEACGGVHYWARELMALGHQVKAMNPLFVKPYLKGNKNDSNDAEAICEAVQRPSMRFVDVKTPEQQAVLHLHQARQLVMRCRIAQSNHIRAVFVRIRHCHGGGGYRL